MRFKEFSLINEIGINVFATCLAECFEINSNQLNETIDITPVSEKDEENYVIKTEIWKIAEDKKDPGTEFRSAYTKSGDYIGDLKMAKFLIKKGITKFEKTNPRHCVCSIGLDEKNGIWYGWSHRAIVGFKIGDKIFEEDFGNDETKFTQHGSKTIKNLNDAKQSAINFARYIS